MKGELVRFSAEDGTELVGTFYEGTGPSIILLHQLGSDRNSWNFFAEELASNNFTVLSIDLRGHGESEGDWKDFDEDDFNDMIYDVEGAISFLKSHNKNIEKLFIIGSSIGANTALNYTSEEKCSGVVLLSPGSNYKGISTEEIETDTPVLIVSTEEDPYSKDWPQKLNKKLENSELKLYPGNEHGTKMLPIADISKTIIKWIFSNLEGGD